LERHRDIRSRRSVVPPPAAPLASASALGRGSLGQIEEENGVAVVVLEMGMSCEWWVRGWEGCVEAVLKNSLHELSEFVAAKLTSQKECADGGGKVKFFTDFWEGLFYAAAKDAAGGNAFHLHSLARLRGLAYSQVNFLWDGDAGVDHLLFHGSKGRDND